MLQTNRYLQKDQSDLCYIERKLVKALPLLQEALNSLKVEEYHLKAQSLQKSTRGVFDSSILSVGIHSVSSIPTISASNKLINQQEIDLKMFVNNLENSGIENDSE